MGHIPHLKSRSWRYTSLSQALIIHVRVQAHLIEESHGIIISTLTKGWSFLDWILPRDDLCQVWSKVAQWFWRRLVKVINIYRYFHSLTIISLWKRALSFIWKILNPQFEKTFLQRLDQIGRLVLGNKGGSKFLGHRPSFLEGVVVQYSCIKSCAYFCLWIDLFVTTLNDY